MRRVRSNLEQKLEGRTRAEQKREEQIHLIYRVGQKISSILSLDELLLYVVRSLGETFKYHEANIFLIEPDSGDLVCKASNTYEGMIPVQFAPRIKVTEGMMGWVFLNGRPLLANDVSKEPRYVRVETNPGTRSELIVPIKIGTETLGVLNLESNDLDAFSEADLFTAQTIADQVAIAIHNARLYEQARELATVEERQRLARDLHDAVTQTLFSASLIAEVLPRLWTQDPDEGRRRLEELRQLTRGALAEMRTLLLELRPAALTEVGLTDLLRQLTEATTGRTRVPVTLAVQGQHLLPPDVQVALYRITQEALNNIAKHADASQVTVSLCHQPERVELLITDDGRGFNTEDITSEHLGLSIMRERATSIGAVISIESQVSHGTRVTIVWSDKLQKEP